LDRGNLLRTISEILSGDDFCGGLTPKLTRIEQLLERLNTNIGFILEYPYVDRHYRDNYYLYHAAKFHKVGRNCIRVHLFEDPDISIEKLKFSRGKYIGYFIVRPLYKYPLGRSLLSPKALKDEDRRFVCCLMRSEVSLLGYHFEVHGFPHIAQDTETHSCAESSLWCFMEYFGSKYSQYKPLLPSQIYQSIVAVSERRLLSSRGLNDHEILRCLQNNGYQCSIYRVKYGADENDTMFQLLKIYIESGIPLLLLLSTKEKGHTLLAIGHGNIADYDVPENVWADVSTMEKKIVVIDDNIPPYKITEITNPTNYEAFKITAFIVLLPVHMFLLAEKVYALVETIFDDVNVGLKHLGGGKWITRLLLTNSRSFKSYLVQIENILDSGIKNLLLHLGMPKFIWICEIYRLGDIENKTCSGLLIIDATGNSNTLISVLLYIINDKLIRHDGTIWNAEKSMSIKPFKMLTYQNNLKGEWNQWMSALRK
jgi:hypothetical protein